MLATLGAGVLAAQTMTPPELVAGRDELASKDFAKARDVFTAYAAEYPDNAQAQAGLGDAYLGLHAYDEAETALRHAVALEPEMWVAHKDLVLVEAKLGRWDDFDRERTVLRLARERGAPNITARESDVIDSFTVAGREWIVREYYEPMGRSQARYNFEHFSPEGRAVEYVSLESAAAAASALQRDEQVKIGSETEHPQSPAAYELNWYTGKGHGTIRHYAKDEPRYEAVRADVLRWLRMQAK